MSKSVKKNNKRWIFVSLISLIIVFGVSIGVGAIIGKTTKDDPDYIKFGINGKVYEVEDGINIEGGTLESEANQILNAFYSVALFGTTNLKDKNYLVDDPNSVDFILSGNGEDEWNSPFGVYYSDYSVDNGFIVTDDSIFNLLESFTKMKYFTDTEDTSVLSYLLDMSSTSPILNILINWIIELGGEDANGNYKFYNPYDVNGIELYNSRPNEDITGVDITTTIIETLSYQDSYQQDVFEDMMIYSYLWQDSASSAYDYNLTKEIAESRPSITSSFSINGDKASESDVFDELKDEDDNSKTITSNDWNYIINEFNKIDGALTDSSVIDNQIQIEDPTNSSEDEDNYGFMGFDGITFGTSAGESINSNWTDASLVWDWEEPYTSEEISEALTGHSNSYDYRNVVYDSHYYISDDTNGEGALISSEDNENSGYYPGNSGTYTVYAYTQLQTYLFKQPKDFQDSIPTDYDPATFSLFANYDDSVDFIERTYSEGNVSDFIKDKGEGTEYIINQWFPNDTLDGEVFLTEALINQNSNLKIKAANYWNDKGFWIDLSGSYEDDYINYIPDSLLY